MKRLLFHELVMFGALSLSPQAFAFSAASSTDANALANYIAGDQINIISASLVSGSESAGTFTGGGPVGLGINEGVLLTSGGVQYAIGPNDLDNAGMQSGTSGNALLNALVPGYSTADATVLEMKFTTASGDLYFNYVFGSEEYNEWVNSSFNDVFGFFLDGENIALIPSTTTPVSINNVNSGKNSGYYRNNDLNDVSPLPFPDIQYDGLTTVLTASKLGLGGGDHTIILAIADAGDRNLDSGVFLQKGSFSGKPTDPDVPDAGSTVLLLGSALGGLAALRRKLS